MTPSMRPGTSIPLLQLDRMPFGLIQYKLGFYNATNVYQGARLEWCRKEKGVDKNKSKMCSQKSITEAFYTDCHCGRDFCYRMGQIRIYKSRMLFWAQNRDEQEKFIRTAMDHADRRNESGTGSYGVCSKAWRLAYGVTESGYRRSGHKKIHTPVANFSLPTNPAWTNHSTPTNICRGPPVNFHPTCTPISFHPTPVSLNVTSINVTPTILHATSIFHVTPIHLHLSFVRIYLSSTRVYPSSTRVYLSSACVHLSSTGIYPSSACVYLSFICVHLSYTRVYLSSICVYL
uniref:Uncharacterized protein n=1 Tax=Branchiostoma floridae TaxID=7739 RepID=C3ZXP3_BRAFL|eukprot:XP_002586695.1 hypothetical protein BRAFLDRAFT_105501 [Branchiostoma floridae]